MCKWRMRLSRGTLDGYSRSDLSSSTIIFHLRTKLSLLTKVCSGGWRDRCRLSSPLCILFRCISSFSSKIYFAMATQASPASTSHDEENFDHSPSSVSASPGLPDEEKATQLRSPATEPVVTAQDWTGPDDPECPLNWSLGKKVYLTIVPSLYCFTATLASSIYIAGDPDIEQRFGIGDVTALLGFSLFIWGLAFGPIITGQESREAGLRSLVLCTSVLLIHKKRQGLCPKIMDAKLFIWGLFLCLAYLFWGPAWRKTSPRLRYAASLLESLAVPRWPLVVGRSPIFGHQSILDVPSRRCCCRRLSVRH